MSTTWGWMEVYACVSFRWKQTLYLGRVQETFAVNLLTT